MNLNQKQLIAILLSISFFIVIYYILFPELEYELVLIYSSHCKYSAHALHTIEHDTDLNIKLINIDHLDHVQKSETMQKYNFQGFFPHWYNTTSGNVFSGYKKKMDIQKIINLTN